MPRCSETLRSRLKLLGMCFEFARRKYSSRRSVQSSTLDLWTRYVDFLFGKQVWGLATMDEFSRPVATPTLKHVLVFDMALRTQIANKLNNGLDIQSAFVKVCGWQKVPDPIAGVIKQVHFLNNVSIEIGSAECKACTAPCYMDLQASTSSGSQGRRGG